MYIPGVLVTFLIARTIEYVYTRVLPAHRVLGNSAEARDLCFLYHIQMQRSTLAAGDRHSATKNAPRDSFKLSLDWERV